MLYSCDITPCKRDNDCTMLAVYQCIFNYVTHYAITIWLEAKCHMIMTLFSNNAALMLAHRLRRCANIKTTLFKNIVFVCINSMYGRYNVF